MGNNKKNNDPDKFQDKEWEELNKRAQELIKFNDFYSLGMVYYEMANFVKNEGKNNSHLLELAYQMKLRFQNNQLMEYKKSNVCTGVEIIAVTNSPGNNSCEECLRLNGKRFTINEALSQNPLPVKDCGHEYGCRCVYGPVVD